MARKLALGWTAACCAALLAGCQTGSGSRVASNPSGGGAFAKQPSNPQPTQVGGGAFPSQRSPSSGGFNTSTGGAYPAAQPTQQFGQPSSGGFQQVPSTPPTNTTSFGQPSPGPGISPINNNPPNNVFISQPMPPAPGAAAPGQPMMPPSFPAQSGNSVPPLPPLQ